jgi:predicted enzyme related to lactoylglutathione lyase
MGYPVVHFEINTASQSERFYEEAFGWTTYADGDDNLQINTNGVCAGTGEPGIEGGIGPSDPVDDFVTFHVQVPDASATSSSEHDRERARPPISEATRTQSAHAKSRS